MIGLVVNGVSMLILGEKNHTHAHGDHDHGAHDHHEHEHEIHDHEEHSHSDHDHHHDDHPHDDLAHVSNGVDHNLKAAYLHVLTDAMTSVLAIIALLVRNTLILFGWTQSWESWVLSW